MLAAGSVLGGLGIYFLQQTEKSDGGIAKDGGTLIKKLKCTIENNTQYNFDISFEGLDSAYHVKKGESEDVDLVNRSLPFQVSFSVPKDEIPINQRVFQRAVACLITKEMIDPLGKEIELHRNNYYEINCCSKGFEDDCSHLSIELIGKSMDV
jgi:hypothetical protein